MKVFEPVSYKSVSITGGFWKERQEVNATATVGAVYDQFDKTGRVGALRHDWRDGEPNKPHIFYDSDIAKWIEGAAYSLHTHKSPDLEDRIDSLVNLIEDGMTPDGYFNSYYQTVEPMNRFTKRENHELYCCGHLIEAAVAYFEATGKRKFLDIMCRYVDYIEDIFFVQKSAKFLTPGHEEIELALVRLWHATGERRYLELSKRFIDLRGDANDQPCFDSWFERRYGQDQAPVVDQVSAEGHAVRFGYLFTAVADMAREFGDERYSIAVRRVWDDIMRGKFYVTGGVGNLAHGEAFGPAFFLPNFQAYTETCASIALAFVANRMLRIDPDSEYSDVLEREIFNGALAGISLDGKSFFYENPLEQKPSDLHFMNDVKALGRPASRLEVFGCSCCPPNIMRMIADIGSYFYNADAESNTVYTHLYNSSRADISLANGRLRLTQSTRYPFDGRVGIKISAKAPITATLAFRMPGWCADTKASFNGEAPDKIVKGYAYFTREWHDGDKLELSFPMKVRALEARPEVAADCGRVALMRGPIVYCLEQCDNFPNLADVKLAAKPNFKVSSDPDLLGGVPYIDFDALVRDSADFGNSLYREFSPAANKVRCRAVPYFAWNNRGEGEVEVWIRA